MCMASNKGSKGYLKQIQIQYQQQGNIAKQTLIQKESVSKTCCQSTPNLVEQSTIFTRLCTIRHGPVLNESFCQSEGFSWFVIPMHGVWMSNGKSTDSRMKHGLSHPVAVVGSTEHRIKGFRVKRIKHRSWWLRRWWMGLILSKSSPDKGDHYCPASTHVFVFNLLTAEMTYKIIGCCLTALRYVVPKVTYLWPLHLIHLFSRIKKEGVSCMM